MKLPRVCVVGPLPPPSGGMGNQCQLLVRLLRSEGLDVELVQTNAPYRPAWVGGIAVLRAGFRLVPYLEACGGSLPGPTLCTFLQIPAGHGISSRLQRSSLPGITRPL